MQKLFFFLVILISFGVNASTTNVAKVEKINCNVLTRIDSPNISMLVVVLKKQMTNQKEISAEYLALNISKDGRILHVYRHFETRPLGEIFTHNLVTLSDLDWINNKPVALKNKEAKQKLRNFGKHCSKGYSEAINSSPFLTSKAKKNLGKELSFE